MWVCEGLCLLVGGVRGHLPALILGTILFPLICSLISIPAPLPLLSSPLPTPRHPGSVQDSDSYMQA